MAYGRKKPQNGFTSLRKWSKLLLTTYSLQSPNMWVEAIFKNLFLNSNNTYYCAFISNSVIYYEEAMKVWVWSTLVKIFRIRYYINWTALRDKIPHSSHESSTLTNGISCSSQMCMPKCTLEDTWTSNCIELWLERCSNIRNLQIQLIQILYLVEIMYKD